MAGITSLRDRRVELCDKFANKALKTRFARWFPLRPGRSTRVSEVYLEEYARCNRLLDSPLFYMRRRLNGKEGKKYGERNKEYRNEEYRKARSAGMRGRKEPKLPK